MDFLLFYENSKSSELRNNMKKNYSSHKHSKWTLLFLFLCIGHSAKADYPIFWQRYTADPSGIEYNGRLYLFCSHDTYNAERGYGYFMNDITCISTDDMKNWTDHGEVFHAKDSKWGAKMTWAPCVVHRNGKFYLYYGDANSGGIGVAVSDLPTGPYIDNHDRPVVGMDTPGVLLYDENNRCIKNKKGVPGAISGSENWGMWCFDPCVFVDDDGQAYMYFGGAHPDNSRIIKLKENMTEVDGSAVKPNTPGFFEASFVHKYRGKYYFSYAGHYFGKPANIEYVMSDKPMEGFRNPGVILPNPPVNDGFNNHHSIFQFKGEWYIAYHNRKVAYENNEQDQRSREYMRSVCIDRLFHNEDGTVQTVEVTRDGLEQLKNVDPYRRNEAETMAKGYGIDTEFKARGCSDRIVTSIHNGDYLKIRGVDFKNGGASKFAASLSALKGSGWVEIRLEGVDGLLIGTLPVSSTGSWGKWQTMTTDVKHLGGVYDLYLVFKGEEGELFRMDYWSFTK